CQMIFIHTLTKLSFIIMIHSMNTREQVDTVVKILDEGGVCVVPTDTVYGLVCNAFNTLAVEKMFHIKRRPKTKPVGLFVSGLEMAKELEDIDTEREELISKYWPGAVTLIFSAKQYISPLVTPEESIGLRMPNSAFLLDVIERLGRPLAQTSANISGKDTPTSAEEIGIAFRDCGEKPNIIIDGGVLQGKPSKILDCRSMPPKEVRE
ncbi:MAG: L-threonylcarbamoyladenylate synthase, partial [bacterium]|nr:L-threonylcarbamoyladenylate synthase [bacterium]